MTYAKVSSKLSAVTDVPITVFRSAYPITKRFELTPTGLSKSAAIPPSAARAEVYTVSDASGLLVMMESLSSRHAIMLGRFKAGDEVDVVAHQPIGNQVRRTKEYAEWPNGACWMVLDVDKDHCVNVFHTPEEVHAALVEIAPCLDGVDCLVTSSTSSGIYAGDTQLRGYGGWHVWFRLARGTDWPDFVDWLMQRCWMFGAAHHIVSSSGNLLERGLIDASVSSPERVQYSGPPTLGDGLEVRRLAAVFGESGVELANWKKLSADDKREVTQRKDLSAHALAGVSKERRDAWLFDRVQQMGGKAGDLTLTGVALQALEARHLGNEWVLELDDGEKVTVESVLDNRAKYHERKCLDPIEPEYDGGRVVGRIYTDGGRVYLHSMAHGGATYVLGGNVNALAELKRLMIYVKEDRNYINRENPQDISTAENINVMYAQEYGFNKTVPLLQEMGVEYVQRSVWWPGKPIIYEHEGVRCLNSCPVLDAPEYTGEDVGPWLAHVRMLWEDQAEWFLDYLAFAVQNPATKQNAHPMLGGRQGVGKDASIYPIKQWYGALGSFGEVAALPDIIDFDDQLVWKKWVCITECAVKDMDSRTAKRATTKLKPLLAGSGSDIQTLNPKSMGRVRQANVSSILMFSNETTPVTVDEDDRRYVFHWHSGLPRDGAYFVELFDWFNAGGVKACVAWLGARDWRERGYSPTAVAHMTAEKANLIVSCKYEDSDLIESCLAAESLDGAWCVSVPMFCCMGIMLKKLESSESLKAQQQHVRVWMADYATRNGMQVCKTDTKSTSRTVLVLDARYNALTNAEKVRYCLDLEAKMGIK